MATCILRKDSFLSVRTASESGMSTWSTCLLADDGVDVTAMDTPVIRVERKQCNI